MKENKYKTAVCSVTANEQSHIPSFEPLAVTLIVTVCLWRADSMQSNFTFAGARYCKQQLTVAS